MQLQCMGMIDSIYIVSHYTHTLEFGMQLCLTQRSYTVIMALRETSFETSIQKSVHQISF